MRTAIGHRFFFGVSLQQKLEGGVLKTACCYFRFINGKKSNPNNYPPLPSAGFDGYTHNPVCLRNCLLPLAVPVEGLRLVNTQMSLVRVLLGVRHSLFFSVFSPPLPLSHLSSHVFVCASAPASFRQTAVTCLGNRKWLRDDMLTTHFATAFPSFSEI